MNDPLISIHTDLNGNPEIDLNFKLRDLFAAFALVAVVGLELEESTHESDAIYAYNAADAMLKQRQDKGL